MSNTFNEKLREAIRPTEWRYALLGQDGAPDQQPAIAKRRRAAKIATLIIPFWLFLLYLNWQRPRTTTTSASAHDTHVNSAFAHLVIPAATGSVSFCRTLFSAGALNYPTPRIINWDRKYEQSNRTDGGFHLAKIEGILNFLQKLDGRHDHELVLVVNGYDTWFQLRPEVLLERYHALNKRSRDYTWPRYGLKYEQTVIFSAQKHCEGAQDSWGCSLAPPSNLPANVYGSKTDRPSDNVMNKWETYRPRYLNADLVIGPVAAMKPLYEYAKWKLEHNKTFQTDREIFSEIFGEQEYYREKKLVDSGRTIKDKHDPRNGKVPDGAVDLHCERCQFGIGLDYRGELSTPMIYSEGNFEHIKFSETNKHRLDPLIQRSTPPHWTPDYSGANHLPQKSWDSLSLHTNRFTGVTPAATHYHPGANVTAAWREQWYHSNLRTLATGHAKSFRIPFAVVKLDSGETQEYWGLNDGYGGVRLHDPNGMPGKWRQWDELCGGDEVGAAVFNDGRGKYQCPVYFLYWDAERQKHQLDTWTQMEKEEKRRLEGADRAGFVPVS